MANKSLWVSYFLWAIGSLVGLHLLYLGRDRQAFLYWCTFGGYCGIGSIIDFFKIPSYVKDTNGDFDYLGKLALAVHRYKKPPFSFKRLIIASLIGNSWSYIWIAALPIDDKDFGHYFYYLKFLGPLAAALAVWLVGNIGRQKGSFYWAALGAFITLPFIFIVPYAMVFCPMTSAFAFEYYGKQWRRGPYPKRSLCRRFVTLSTGMLLYSSIWAAYLLFTAEITTQDGRTVKVKDALINFLNSSMYKEFKKNAKKLFDDARQVGFKKAWENLIELVDPFGEHHALKVLSLKKGVSESEITAQYKKLSRKWHPDRHKSQEDKEVAQQKFIEINNAYETLSKIKKNRRRRNKQYKEDGNPTQEDFEEFDEL